MIPTWCYTHAYFNPRGPLGPRLGHNSYCRYDNLISIHAVLWDRDQAYKDLLAEREEFQSTRSSGTATTQDQS